MDRAPGFCADQAGCFGHAAPLCAGRAKGRLSGTGAGGELSPFAIRTSRLLLSPVVLADLPDIQAIKSDPRVFAIMLGGVRSPARAAAELADDMAFWAARSCGMWTVRDAAGGGFLGLTGLMQRPDGRGIALRFALWPEARGRGLAREAAGAALRFGHDRAGLDRIIAVARQTNFASRMVLGGIGMREVAEFDQGGHRMTLYESARLPGRPPGN